MFDRRDFLKYAGACGLSVTAGCSLSNIRASASDRKPNIVLILVDDLGYGHFGANMADYTAADLNMEYVQRDIDNGDPTYDIDKAMEAARESTKHLTAIASEGVRCSEAYVPLPLCAPSRAAIMTGRYPQRYGTYCNLDVGYRIGLPLDEYCLANVLKDVGYTNGVIGKWHLQQFDIPKYVKDPERRKKQHPLKRGFDYYYGFNHSTSVYYNPDHWYRNYEKVQVKQFTTDAITKEAIDFIEREKDNPFFLYVAYNAVHDPLFEDAPEKYLKRFDLGSHRANNFNAYVAALDDGIGSIMNKLKTLGLDKDTLFVFLSDNGPAGDREVPLPAAGPLTGNKGQLWQGGVKTPMIVRYPRRLPAGKTYRGLVSSMDILPTAIAAAGSKIPLELNVDGKNMLPALNNGDFDVHEELFFAGEHCNYFGLYGKSARKDAKEEDIDVRGSSPVGWAVRKGDYMLRYWPHLERYELYNVVKDSSEKNDLLKNSDGSYEKMLHQLKQNYKQWFSQMKRPVLSSDKHWDDLYPKY
ncbi:MAG: sulfatase-like hydrolase/transferase [Sedimentisphaeraceae bacterium JB056]